VHGSRVGSRVGSVSVRCCAGAPPMLLEYRSSAQDQRQVWRSGPHPTPPGLMLVSGFQARGPASSCASFASLSRSSRSNNSRCSFCSFATLSSNLAFALFFSAV